MLCSALMKFMLSMSKSGLYCWEWAQIGEEVSQKTGEPYDPAAHPHQPKKSGESFVKPSACPAFYLLSVPPAPFSCAIVQIASYDSQTF